jgi:hypothetical protein
MVDLKHNRRRRILDSSYQLLRGCVKIKVTVEGLEAFEVLDSAKIGT